MLDKKVMQFANFNITFGDNDEPMLEHLLDIIYPAFTSGIGKGTTKDNKRYIIQNFDVDLTGIDIIKGYRADDSYFSYAEDFVTNALSLNQLSRALYLGKLGTQIVLVSKKAFEKITYLGS